MDTSETYIKMGDCEEIQKDWQVDCGDYVKLAKPDGRIVIVVEHPRPCIEKITWLVRIAFPQSTGDNLDYKYTKDAVWLPRQDQLQAIMNKPMAELLGNFFRWLLLGLSQSAFNSMEKLWLAFVMREKYNKVWDGENWVKEGSK